MEQPINPAAGFIRHRIFRLLIFFLSLTFLFLLASPVVALGAINYSRNPSDSIIASPVTFNISADTWNDLEVNLNPDNQYWTACLDFGFVEPPYFGSMVYPSSVLSASFQFNLPNNYAPVVVGVCIASTNTIDGDTTDEFLQLEGDGSYPVFTVSQPPVPENGDSGDGGYYYIPTPPKVSLSNDLSGKILAGTVKVDYEVIDENVASGHPPYGLLKKPVSVFYNSFGSDEWSLIVENLAATGTALWDTNKVKDGIYKLKVVAKNSDLSREEYTTDNFTVDNTPPAFIIEADPTFTKGEPVRIKIESNEPLKKAPRVSVSQFNHEPVNIDKIESDVLMKLFTATYEIIKGFDGQAEIKIEGEDLAGNTGQSILSGGNFAVGVNPPPPPIIENPAADLRTTSTLITITGSASTALNAYEVKARINNKKEYHKAEFEKDQFLVKDIKLDPEFNKGLNVINIFVFDKRGDISSPAVLKVSLNKAPEMKLTETPGQFANLSGNVKFSWQAFDFNSDPLTYSVELSDDAGRTWQGLAENLKESNYVWDLSALPDGPNYMIKIVSSDGLEKSEATSPRMTVNNKLPAIILEASGDVFTNKTTKILKGFVRSKEELLKELKLSVDNGQTWKKILPDDGIWDSSFEKFRLDLKVPTDGFRQVILRGLTTAGRQVVNAQRLKLFFDNIEPSLKIGKLPKGILTDPYLNLNALVLDNLAGAKSVNYSIDGKEEYEATVLGGWGSERAEFKIAHPVKIADGKHEIRVRALDKGDNSSKIQTLSFFIDATPPRLAGALLKANGQAILPKNNSVFEIIAPSSLELFVALLGEPVQPEILINKEKFSLIFDEERKIWHKSFTITAEGNTLLEISVKDPVGNKNVWELGEIISHRPDGSDKTNPFLKWVINLFKFQ